MSVMTPDHKEQSLANSPQEQRASCRSAAQTSVSSPTETAPTRDPSNSASSVEPLRMEPATYRSRNGPTPIVDSKPYASLLSNHSRAAQPRAIGAHRG